MSRTNKWREMVGRVVMARCRRTTNRKPALRWRSSVPRIEALESRTLLSTLTVTNPADGGPGSLRAAVADAQSGDQIIFDPSMEGQTITLTTGELAITKDLDIEGLGADQLAISSGGPVSSCSAQGYCPPPCGTSSCPSAKTT